MQSSAAVRPSCVQSVTVPEAAQSQPGMSGVGHTIPMCYVLSFLGGARDQGVDVPALLARHGISPAMIDSPLSRVSLAQFASLLKHLRRRMRDEFLGFGLRPVKLGTFSLAAEYMMRCATLEDALRAGFGVYRLAFDDFTAHLRVESGQARVLLQERERRKHGGFIQSAFLYWVLGLASWLIQQRIPVSDASLNRGLPPHGGHLYGIPTRFSAPTSGISFDASWLREPIVVDQRHLRSLEQQLPGALLVRFRDHASLSEQVRMRLQRQLPTGLPSLEQTAWHLRMTPHSLRRRLFDQGTSFQIIKNALRRDAAIDLLTRSSHSLGEIAQQLGFSEPSTFHRSFKLWTGVAPGEYRRTHAGSADQA